MSDRGELTEELAQRVAAFEVVNEVFERDACTSEARRTVHDFGLDGDGGFGHEIRFLYCNGFQL